MMTLNEAIEHCREKACGNSECALEHQQLADWLEELQTLKSLHWIKMSDVPLLEGIEVIGYNKEWVDEDFNPTGTRIGFINSEGWFTSAKWVNDLDCYATCCEEGDDFETTQTVDGKEIRRYWKNGEPIEGHLPNMPTHYMIIPKVE